MTATRYRTLPIGVFAMCVFCASAAGLDLAAISDRDASRGIKGALDQGAAVAVAKLGVAGGFLDNPKVKIPLPPALEEISKAMRVMGRGKDADELVVTMNRAAEQAVPEAKALLVGAVKSMSVNDAKNILTGGDGSVTRFFRDKTQAALTLKFLPIVKRSTDRLGVAQQYNQVAGQAAKFGLVKGDAANIEHYVTGKALDGLYLMIGEEEHKIRENPGAAATSIVSKVFGALH